MDAQERYRKSRAWSDRYMPQVRQIIADQLIQIADLDKDHNEATDLVCKGGQFAVRLRKMGVDNRNFNDFKHEFTIRSYLPSGKPTELLKIRAGFADYGFYGWVGDDQVKYWTIYDLNVFRRVLTLCPELKDNEKSGEAGVRFIAFKFADFPPDFIVASSLPGMSIDDVSGRIVFDGVAA